MNASLTQPHPSSERVVVCSVCVCMCACVSACVRACVRDCAPTFMRTIIPLSGFFAPPI